jgi:catechol 2,3-dioxygenase-like lactoylglutathione lyase family enzyme
MRFKWMLPALFLATAVCVFAQSGAAVRPKITGVSHLAVYTSDPAATEHYYTVTLGAEKLPDPEDPKGVKYAFSRTQFVEVLPLPANAGVNRMDHIAFNTDSAERLRRYLAAKGWAVPDHVTKASDNSLYFEVKDPEGNRVQFIQVSPLARVEAPKAIGHHIIHVGMMIHSRDKEDTFYRALLGFRPYWYGGMQDNKTDWVAQQVPDGHDWLEYMVAGGEGTGIPANMSQRTLGVLDHISIGEQDIKAAYSTLKDSGRLKDVRCDDATKVGRDGKIQFNMYDPDGIRAELMTLHAVEKPCCSPFTAPDPSE